MPDLDLLFTPSRPETPAAFGGSQAWEARVSRVNARGEVFVTIPGFDRTLQWGPCMPPGASVDVGDQVTVVLSNRGRPWLLGAGGGGSPAVIPLEPWHYVGDPGEPAFQGGWRNYGAPFGGVAFRKFPDGKVKLKGLTDGGTTGVVFTLPPGYRPPTQTLLWPGLLTSSLADLRINANGDVSLNWPNEASGYFTLSQVEFDTESVTEWLTGPRGERGPMGPQGPSGPADTGDVKLTARETPPPGWLLCRGQEIARAEYAALFEAIGTFYGAGNGVTTFNVPDLRDRVAVGAWSEAVGATGGATTVALSTAEMPHHSHGGITEGADRGIDHVHHGTTNAADRSLDHLHGIFWGQVAAAFDRQWGGGTFAQLQTVGGGVGWWGGDGQMSNSIDRAIDHLHSFQTGGSDRDLNHLHGVHGEGGGGAHNNMQPYQRLNYVIKF